MFDAEQLAQQVKTGSITEQEARKILVKTWATTALFPKIIEAFRRGLYS
jgi:hypothetical protein